MARPILVGVVAVAKVLPLVVVPLLAYVSPNPLFHKVVTNVSHRQSHYFVPKTNGAGGSSSAVNRLINAEYCRNTCVVSEK